MGAPASSRTTTRYREGTRRAVGIRLPRARSWGAPRVGRDLARDSDRRHHGGMRSAPHGTASATRSNGRASKIFDRRSNAGTDGCKAFAVGAYQRGTTCRGRRPAVLRRPSAPRLCRSPPLLMALHVTGRLWYHHRHERGPFGFSRWGRGQRFGERASCAASSRSPRSPQEIPSFPPAGAPRMRKANNNQPNISRRGRKGGGRGTESQGFLRLSGREPVPTGCADGRHSSRHHCRHIFRGCRHRSRHTGRHHRRHRVGAGFRRRESGRCALRLQRAAGRNGGG